MTSIESQFDRRLLFDHPDPYPLFALLRQSQPVLATAHEGRPTFLLTKYDDCLAALQDAETYSSRSNAEAGQVLGRTVLEMDGREHSRYRALVQPAFVPKALDGLQALSVAEVAFGPHRIGAIPHGGRGPLSTSTRPLRPSASVARPAR